MTRWQKVWRWFIVLGFLFSVGFAAGRVSVHDYRYLFAWIFLILGWGVAYLLHHMIFRREVKKEEETE